MSPPTSPWLVSAHALTRHAERHRSRVGELFPSQVVPKRIKTESFGEHDVGFRESRDGSIDDLEEATLEFKHFLEDCRSALDYAAFHLYRSLVTFGPLPEKTPKVYFPYSERLTMPADFRSRQVPGTGTWRYAPQEVVDVLMESQPFRHDEHWWLPRVCETLNEAKHENLVPVHVGDSENGWYYNVGDEWYRFPSRIPLATSSRYPKAIDIDHLMMSTVQDLPRILEAVVSVAP
ncbi:MAG: hypothetical protein KGI98_13835 [Euryarchaeota archaeon]|nr:hypothetical protein [Euryarchaeota archaeon]MDE2045986.1 hypothetical protein [Thermoplasmata archaeon]